MIIEKTNSVGGAWWDKKEEITDGEIGKLTSEAQWIDGQNGKQLVAKMRIKSSTDEKNVSINNASKNALIEAFGSDSNNWQGKYLTLKTEKTVVAGKRGVALYMIPDGFEMKEDANGFIVITKVGGSTGNDYPEQEINLDDIPF